MSKPIDPNDPYPRTTRLATWTVRAILFVLAALVVVWVWSEFKTAQCQSDCQDAGFDSGKAYCREGCVCITRTPLEDIQ